MGNAVNEAEGTFSTNPADYDARTQAIVNAMADVFFNGDRAKAWERIFQTAPDTLRLIANAKRKHSQAKLHLKATPPN